MNAAESEDTGDEVPGYDPRDPAKTPTGGRVRKAYQKLLQRGQTGAAEELRWMEDISDQDELASQVSELDPAQDEPRTTSKIAIVSAYEALIEAGNKDEAERLRGLETVRDQRQYISELREQGYDIPRQGMKR